MTEILKYFSWAEPQIKAVKALKHVSNIFKCIVFVQYNPVNTTTILILAILWKCIILCWIAKCLFNFHLNMFLLPSENGCDPYNQSCKYSELFHLLQRQTESPWPTSFVSKFWKYIWAQCVDFVTLWIYMYTCVTCNYFQPIQQPLFTFFSCNVSFVYWDTYSLDIVFMHTQVYERLRWMHCELKIDKKKPLVINPITYIVYKALLKQNTAEAKCCTSKINICRNIQKSN